MEVRVDYLWALLGSFFGVLVVSIPVVLAFVLGSEYESGWLLRPGVILMIGCVLGCWSGLRWDGHGGAGATASVLTLVLVVLYASFLFIPGSDMVAVLGIVFLPLLSPLLTVPSRAVVLALIGVISTRAPHRGEGG